MEKAARQRRTLLKSLILAAVSLPLLGKYLSPKVAARRVLLEIPKGELPAEGALVYRESRVALLRREGEVYALDLLCTHLGCVVNLTPRELVCPCHGSSFDLSGEVLRGPADRPLRRLAVEELDLHWRILA